MAFPASQTLIQENCHEPQQELEQHHQQQQLPVSAKLASSEDVDNHYGGTPIRFLPLHHVYSATSPCVSASGSSNVVSKKVRARKLTLIDGCLDDIRHVYEHHQCEDEKKVEEEERLPKSEPHADSSPQSIRVYSRRQKKKSTSTVENKNSLFYGSMVEKEVKAEPIEDEGFVGDVLVGFPNKKRRVGCSELIKLGVDSSVLSRLNGPRLRESRFQYNLNSRKSVVKKKKQNSSVNHKNQDDWQAKKWFQLAFDGVNPMVYWPLDDVWYSGSISGYNTESNQHKVKYEDGDEEELILSVEQIKFHISGEEMQSLNLTGKRSMDDDDPDYSLLMGLAASVDESRELEPGDIIWAKLTGHAMWPAVIMDGSLSDRKGLNRCSGGRSVPVQFFGTHDFARLPYNPNVANNFLVTIRIQVKQIKSFVKGLFSCFHLKCKSSRFLRSLKEAKMYLSEQILPKSMLSMQRVSVDVQTVESNETAIRDDDLSNPNVPSKFSSDNSFSERHPILPNGYLSISIKWKDLDRCNVCHMDEEYENNLFLQCDKCRMMVHVRCYGEESVDGGLWLCKLCRVGAPEFTPPCQLCPVTGGAMKPTTDGHWAHLACAIWIPETCLSDIKRMEPIDGLSRINKDRWKLVCSICNVPWGACIQLEDEDRLHLMSLDEDEEEQCIRLLSFCKKHRQPSNDRPIMDEGNGTDSCQRANYIPPINDSGCARCEPYDYSSRRGRKEPAAASAKRLFLENRPYLVGAYCLFDSSTQTSAKDKLIIGTKFSSAIRNGSSNDEALPSIFSMADKYRCMRETFRKRLAFGKSRIHGFGIFAKQPHKAGDMVIEYTGEVVRPPVADRREHLIYNSLVGAGTYMFRINDERVIDATRAGSIAHLINHSCEPNCYSRFITVSGEEHIIIFAKRDIGQWEELTYDYRFFSIDEQLSCYCGSQRCRGVVNDIEAEEQAAKRCVPRSELIDWRGD
ncbi:Histone-lysine N-methyltransferase ATX2 [Bienertia sinuspersici]